MSWLPDPADYSAPTNEPPASTRAVAPAAATVQAAATAPPEPEPAEHTIGFEPPDAPTITGTMLTENVNQAGVA